MEMRVDRTTSASNSTPLTHELQIEGVAVHFLFEPYPQQVDYMRAVIRALEMKIDAVLESPTGTGKTLSLLCSTIAWLRHKQWAATFDHPTSTNGPKIVQNGAAARRIFYCSRTHSQITQVVSELNRTIYRDVPTAVLGGREQLCTNDLVSRLKNPSAMSAACNGLRRRHACFPYNKWDKTSPEELNEIYYTNGAPDIEDLAKVARNHSHCAYYRSKQMAENASLIFLPYIYLLDPNLRRRHKIDVANSIIIFDEAHNLVNVCEESSSASFTTTQLSQAITEIQKAIVQQQEKDELIRAELDVSGAQFGALSGKENKKDAEGLNINIAKMLLESLFNLEELIEKYYTLGVSFATDMGTVLPKEVKSVKLLKASTLLEMLSLAGLSAQSVVVQELEKISTKITDMLEQSESRLEKEMGHHLDAVSAFILLVLNVTSEIMGQDAARMENFKFWINIEKSDPTTDKVVEYSLHWGCFDASVTMRQLKRLGARSIILTSGTLAPLETFSIEMGLNVGDLFSAPHAAKDGQVKCYIVPETKSFGPSTYWEAPNGKMAKEPRTLTGSFRNRNDKVYMELLGRTALEAIKSVPQGVLVFFPSFAFMENCQNHWKQMGILEEMDQVKKIAVEPKNKMQMKEQTMLFHRHIDSGSGAIFFAVAKGKLAEGINFADRHARAVIMIGLPFAPVFDVRIMLKRKILRDKLNAYKAAHKNDFDLKAAPISDTAWYNMEAMRTVNQAIGRVLRHKDDFGIIVMLDSRFADIQRSYFPSWLIPGVKVIKDIDAWVEDMHCFFNKRGMATTYGKRQDAKSPFQMPDTTKRPAKRPLIRIKEEKKDDFDLSLFDSEPLPMEFGVKPSAPKNLFAALDAANEPEPIRPCKRLSTKKDTQSFLNFKPSVSKENTKPTFKRPPLIKLPDNYFTDTTDFRVGTLEPMASPETSPGKVKKQGLKEAYQKELLAAKKDPSRVVQAARKVFLPDHPDVYKACQLAFMHMNADAIQPDDWKRIVKTLKNSE